MAQLQLSSSEESDKQNSPAIKINDVSDADLPEVSEDEEEEPQISSTVTEGQNRTVSRETASKCETQQSGLAQFQLSENNSESKLDSLDELLEVLLQNQGQLAINGQSFNCNLTAL